MIDAVINFKDLLGKYPAEIVCLILATFVISLLCILWFLWMHARLYSDLECLFDRRIRFLREYGALPCNILILNALHIVWIIDCVIIYNPNNHDIIYLLLALAGWILANLGIILYSKRKNRKELFFSLIFYAVMLADLSVITVCYTIFLQYEHQWTVIGLLSFAISIMISTWVLSRDSFGIQCSNIFLRFDNKKWFLFKYVGDSIICGDEQDRAACSCYNLISLDELRGREIYVQDNRKNQDKGKSAGRDNSQTEIGPAPKNGAFGKCWKLVLKNRKAYTIETIGILLISLVACIILGVTTSAVRVAIVFAVVNIVITLFQFVAWPFDDKSWINLLKSRFGSFGVLCISIFGGGYAYEAVRVINNSWHECIAFLLILPALWLCYGMLVDCSRGDK